MSESRTDSLNSWHADWTGLRVAVLGLGASGFSSADTLLELGASVTVFSESHTDEREQLLAVIGGDLVLMTPGLEHAPEARESLSALDPELVVVSPGFAADHPLIVWARERELAVWGEMELAWRVRDKVVAADWIVAAGGADATAAVRVAETILLAGGVKAIWCGSGGMPVLDAIRAPEGWDVIVVAASDAQLHYTTSISALASSCIDSRPQDRAPWMSDALSRAALARVFDETRVACIYNKGDLETQAMVEEADVVEGCRAIGVGLGIPGLSDFGVVEGILCDRAFLDDRHSTAIELAVVDDLEPAGLMTREGVLLVLAACALARAYGVEPSAVGVALAALAIATDD